jgi:hypothetical protein
VLRLVCHLRNRRSISHLPSVYVVNVVHYRGHNTNSTVAPHLSLSALSAPLREPPPIFFADTILILLPTAQLSPPALYPRTSVLGPRTSLRPQHSELNTQHAFPLPAPRPYIVTSYPPLSSFPQSLSFPSAFICVHLRLRTLLFFCSPIRVHPSRCTSGSVVPNTFVFVLLFFVSLCLCVFVLRRLVLQRPPFIRGTTTLCFCFFSSLCLCVFACPP